MPGQWFRKILLPNFEVFAAIRSYAKNNAINILQLYTCGLYTTIEGVYIIGWTNNIKRIIELAELEQLGEEGLNKWLTYS